VDLVLLKTRVIFITHIHGDHQLGILKMMQERDLILSNMVEEQRTELFVVVPFPMMEWMQTY
jgi:ribonuclease BN (tRNA processing enzyme)